MYPKNFVWTGWHPFCRCATVAVRAKEDEFLDYQRKLLDGEDVSGYKFSGTVDEMPKNFKGWVGKNADRIKIAKKQPYFIKDNSTIVEAILDPKPKVLTTLEKAKLRHDARTPEQIETIKNRWAERQKMQSAFEKIMTPDMIYKKDSTKLSYLERSNNMLNAIIGLFGENSQNGKWAKGWIGLGDNQSRFNTIRKSFNQILGSGGVNRLSAINRLNELKSASDLNLIPMQWRQAFNDTIKKINTYNFTLGYNGIVNHIEYAYNIYRLSKIEAIKKIGFGSISYKMPYQIFTEFEKTIPGFVNSIPKKAFFDRFDEFIPLYTSGDKGAYFSPYWKHVVISLSDKDNITRLTNSTWYRDGLFHHEFGHAYDHLKGIALDKDLRSIFDKYATIYNADKGVSIKGDIKNILNKVDEDFTKRHKELYEQRDNATSWTERCKIVNEINKLKDIELTDIKEQFGAFTDVLQAMMKEHDFISPRGHSVNYFKKRDKQLAEFIAHASENYWSGNPYFKELSPQLYEEMRQYIQKFK